MNTLTEPYYHTTDVHKVGRTPCIYIEKSWNIPEGAKVHLKVWKHDDPHVVFLKTTRITKTGTGQLVLLEQKYDIEPGDFVTLELRVQEEN